MHGIATGAFPHPHLPKPPHGRWNKHGPRPSRDSKPRETRQLDVASEPEFDAAKTRATMVTIMVMVMVATIVAKRSAPDGEELSGSGRPQAKNSCWALLAICGKAVSR